MGRWGSWEFGGWLLRVIHHGATGRNRERRQWGNGNVTNDEIQTISSRGDRKMASLNHGEYSRCAVFMGEVVNASKMMGLGGWWSCEVKVVWCWRVLSDGCGQSDHGVADRGGGGVVSRDAGAVAGGSVPVSSDVQPVHDRRGGAVWAVAGRLAGGEADLPVPSAEPGRVRPGVRGRREIRRTKLETRMGGGARSFPWLVIGGPGWSWGSGGWMTRPTEVERDGGPEMWSGGRRWGSLSPAYELWCMVPSFARCSVHSGTGSPACLSNSMIWDQVSNVTKPSA